jgi:hypothetical protein
VKIRERIADLKKHSGSNEFCGPCSSGSRGQHCDLYAADIHETVCELEELLR